MPLFDEKDTKHTGRVAIVVSRFNYEITTKLLEGSRARLHERGVDGDDVTVVFVPGAVEIPLTAQKLAQLSVYDAIIALGAVVRGETDHYDYVCTMVSNGCQQVSLQYDVPVIFGVLTTDNEAQAHDRLGGAHGHKGRDAADAALEMASLMKKLQS
jgi:6,7-dimethyl-8-ribityllumazine synthase